jgi:hypothetical protein
MECNPRFTMATEIIVRSGIDSPLIVYNHAAGFSGPEANGFRTGVRLWFPYSDYSAFQQYREAGELTAAQWLRSVCHRQHISIFRWSDPLPALAVAAQELTDMIERRIQRYRTNRLEAKYSQRTAA